MDPVHNDKDLFKLFTIAIFILCCAAGLAAFSLKIFFYSLLFIPSLLGSIAYIKSHDPFFKYMNYYKSKGQSWYLWFALFTPEEVFDKDYVLAVLKAAIFMIGICLILWYMETKIFS